MKILALEFSSNERSVAIAETSTGSAVAQTACKILGTSSETKTQSTPAFRLIGRALGEAQLEREQIECIAVGLGPGSYTGIRAAIAIAQGWQLGRPVSSLGIGSVEAIALRAWEEGNRGAIDVAIDAQRNEFYLAGFELESSGPVARTRTELAPRAALEELIAAGKIVVGPDLDRRLPGARLLFPGAEQVARLAAGRTDFVPGEKLEPIYLRPISFVKAPPARTDIPFGD